MAAPAVLPYGLQYPVAEIEILKDSYILKMEVQNISEKVFFTHKTIRSHNLEYFSPVKITNMYSWHGDKAPHNFRLNLKPPLCALSDLWTQAKAK
jgi:hypothetical protein